MRQIKLDVAAEIEEEEEKQFRKRNGGKELKELKRLMEERPDLDRKRYASSSREFAL